MAVSGVVLVFFVTLPLVTVSIGRRYDVGHKESLRREAARVLQQLVDLENQINARDIGREEQMASLWMDEVDPELRRRSNRLAEASWNYGNNLTEENERVMHEIDEEQIEWSVPIIAKGRRYLKDIGKENFQNKTLGWMIEKLVGGSTIAKDTSVNKRMEKLSSKLSSIYGTATVVKGNRTYQLEPDLAAIMADSRDYDELLWAWRSWRDATGPRMRDTYAEMVSLMNIAATDNGFSDAGQAWRVANFDEDGIEPMADKVYQKILPFYKQLHAYLRRKLIEKYPNKGISPTGPIPAHLLGDMWGQHWNALIDLLLPYPAAPTESITDTMKEKKYTPAGMFKEAEKFFTSIGLEEMTKTFWDKTVMTRAEDREMVCHASAWDFYTQDDFRIKMCAVVNEKYLQTIHHEMGHIQYYMQYRNQPVVFRAGANSAFHEAIGDTIALSVMTPKHLTAIGLLGEEDADEDEGKKVSGDVSDVDINFLMKIALEKIAFLPFGYVIDKYRWEVFRGKVTESDYNRRWWQFREKYQGVKAPVARSENDFDPGAKYHVAASVPYIRYFFSFIGQFQFHEALCKASGHEGALHNCDIYQSEEAGDLLKSVLSLGASRPWREVMDKFTGQREFSVDAILHYFRPLHDWLVIQNQGKHVGW